MKLLLVEDEARIQEFVRDGLSEDGFEVAVVSTAEEAMERMSRTRDLVDAFLLDILLPGLSGLDLCRWLRDTGHKEPIILLTAKGSIEDKVAGLDAGADDYLTKPFAIAELRARFRALSRKAQGYPREPLVVADLRLDPNTREVTRGGKVVSLSRKETDLLEYLMRNPGRVVTRSMIADAVWENETSQYTNVIDVFINHLRKKIDSEPDQGVRLLHTVRGKGFRLTDQPGLAEE
jgi:DNA-binding response OmpR family regulator